MILADLGQAITRDKTGTPFEVGIEEYRILRSFKALIEKNGLVTLAYTHIATLIR